MSHCILEQRDGKYYCINCDGLPLKGNYIRQCPSAPAPVDATQWFTTYYRKQNYPMLPLSVILSKLDRCRSAGCPHLRNDVCEKPPKRDCCRQRRVWFSMLAGGEDCEFWLPV